MTSCTLYDNNVNPMANLPIILKGRQRKQSIRRMKKSNGEMVEPEEILEVLARHWEELGKSRSTCRGDGSRRESPDVSGSQLGRSGWGCEDVEARESPWS